MQCVRAWQYVRMRAGRARVCVFGLLAHAVPGSGVGASAAAAAAGAALEDGDGPAASLALPTAFDTRTSNFAFVDGRPAVGRAYGGEGRGCVVAGGRGEEGGGDTGWGEQGKGGDAGWQVAEAGT